MGWEWESSSGYAADSTLFCRWLRGQEGTNPALGVCTAVALRVGWLLAFSALKCLCGVHLFPQVEGGHFESYCSSQACQGALSWGRDPDEVSTYGFLLDLCTSYPFFPVHVCLQFLCSAAQHRPEDTPALPRESTNPGAAGWLLAMGLKALVSCGLMSLVVLP